MVEKPNEEVALCLETARGLRLGALSGFDQLEMHERHARICDAALLEMLQVASNSVRQLAAQMEDPAMRDAELHVRSRRTLDQLSQPVMFEHCMVDKIWLFNV